jgi:hypothetical protein
VNIRKGKNKERRTEERIDTMGGGGTKATNSERNQEQKLGKERGRK